jgi:uncharacterized membrane protein
MWYEYIIWFVFYSVAGWVYETIVCSAEQRKLVMRGFLSGPYCPIYGFGAIIDLSVIGWIENPVLLFLAGATLACLLEYFTAWLLEVFFHAKWWDYSEMKFNIKGRVCALGALVFGLFAVFLVKFGHPLVVRQTAGLPVTFQILLAIFLLAVLLLDTVVTITQLSMFNEKLKGLQKILTEPHAGPHDYLERAIDAAIYLKLDVKVEAILDRINKQEQRILHAFPYFRSTRYNDAVNRIRDHLKGSGS